MKKSLVLALVAIVCTICFSASASAGLFGHKKCCCPCYETVCVPYEYTVKIPVYEDREIAYKVCKLGKVAKEIEVCVDRGYWEEYEATVCCKVGCHLSKRHCCCEPQVVTCKRWVPNFEKETREVKRLRLVRVEKTMTCKVLVGYEEEVRTGVKRVRVLKECGCGCTPSCCEPAATAPCCQ